MAEGNNSTSKPVFRACALFCSFQSHWRVREAAWASKAKMSAAVSREDLTPWAASPSLDSPTRLISAPRSEAFYFWSPPILCTLSSAYCFCQILLTRMLCKHLRLSQQTLVSTTKPQPWLCSLASRELSLLLFPEAATQRNPSCARQTALLLCLMSHYWDRKTNTPSSRHPSQTKSLNSPLQRGSNQEESISSPSADALSVCPSPTLWCHQLNPSDQRQCWPETPAWTGLPTDSGLERGQEKPAEYERGLTHHELEGPWNYNWKFTTVFQNGTLAFIAALFTIAKTWEQTLCPLTGEWVKKMS